MTSGVYKIQNTINGKSYIGSSKRIEKRYGEHRSLLRNNKHHSKILQGAWNKYGEGSFLFDIIEICPVDQLEAREQYYLDNLKPELNVAKDVRNNRGRKWSAEERLKHSARLKGHMSSEEASRRAKLGVGKRVYKSGWKASSQTKEAIAAHNRKPVVAVDPNGLVLEFGSLAAAAKHLGKGANTITNYIKSGKCKQGYIWTFKQTN